MLKYTVAQKGIKGEKGTSPGSALDFKPTWTYNTIFPNHQAFQSMTSITSVGPSPSSTRTGSNDWSSTGTTVSPGVNTPLVNWYWDMINDFDALCKQLHEYNLFEQSNAFSDCIVYAVFYENHCPRPEHKATADEEDMINNYFNAMYPQMKKKVKIYMSTAMFLECYRVLGRKSFTQRLIEEYFVTGMPLHYIVAQLMESHRAQVAAASSKHAILYKPQNQNFLREFNIENGTDVRTTVMIRNIPNRLTVVCNYQSRKGSKTNNLRWSSKTFWTCSCLVSMTFSTFASVCWTFCKFFGHAANSVYRFFQRLQVRNDLLQKGLLPFSHFFIVLATPLSISSRYASCNAKVTH